MTVAILAGIFFVLFCILSRLNFKLAVGLFVVFLPSYFIRFNIGFLPTTFLEVCFFALFISWVFCYLKNDWQNIFLFCKTNRALLFFILLFFVGSVIGIFISFESVKAFGIWRAYFFEPFLFFIILVGRGEYFSRKDLVWFAIFSTVSVSALAVAQKITGQFYSPTLVNYDLQGKVTSFFTTPNAIGLYIGPMIPFAVYLFYKTTGWQKRAAVAIATLALVAVFFSYSQGAWISFGAGLLALLWFLGYKKTTAVLLLAGVAVILLVPTLRSAVLFQDKASGNRLILWKYTLNYTTDSAKNFVTGAGLRSFFERVQKPVNDFTKIEPLIYPHNILLNFWSEVGLFGMIGFVGIFILCLKKIFSREKDFIFRAVAISALVIFFVHGLVDVPYFKNDLAFIWWFIFGIIYL